MYCKRVIYSKKLKLSNNNDTNFMHQHLEISCVLFKSRIGVSSYKRLKNSLIINLMAWLLALV